MSNAAAAVAALDLFIQMIDRLSAASALVKKAHSEGRTVNLDELAEIRAEFGALLSGLDASIERAKAEGR